MDKIGHGKWGGWIVPLGVLLRLFIVITAQPGFLSISCGGKTDHTAENNITWVTDAGYIDVGQRADIGNASALGSYLHSLRYFPKPLNKSCYQLPVTPDAPYLLRLWFVAGNSSLATQGFHFSFSIETADILATQKVTILDISEPIYYEFIFVTSRRVLYICLVRTFSTVDPFISAIELRRLQDGMYQNDLRVGGRILALQSRYDVGGNSVVRYPQDKFDRIWTPFESSRPSRNVISKEPISTTNTENLPPTSVMQTASVTLPETQPFLLNRTFESTAILLVLYFAEIETLNMSESRSFDVMVDGVQHSTITLMRNYSALEVTISPGTEIKTFELVESTNSTLPPIINAYEYYWDVNNSRPTYSNDIDILNAIKGRFHIKDWISDPCYLIPWNGISCDNITGDIRISEIDLSGRKLTGSVPDDIGDLTALVNLSLDNNAFSTMPNFNNLSWLERLSLANNRFTGSIPASIGSLNMLERLSLANNRLTGSIPASIGGLIYLERLYLQNNRFIGSPKWLSEVENLTKLYLQNNKFNGNLEWLSQLKNLKELNIANNNFSGVIPAQLLLNCSLKLNYSGNPYLGMNKRECILQNSSKNNSEKNKLKVVLGTTVSGIIIITLIVGIVVKFRIKEEGVATERTGAKNEPKHFLYQDYSMAMVPNPTKCRAFTLNDMTVATQSFSHEIGRGGFGSVFFGKLPEGQFIAVKVLSSFSRQGIQEFLNEVDLLSKINHRNLVSLLGYCNETKEVMLIYEHMSAGSLRDHLHGPSAENSELNWKRRLKIALDAAQGLEYLHVGCTPKIIHRDIKSDNILLDTNLNGKLADFGLSRMTMGEATHVTTGVKGTFGYLDPEYFNTQMLTEKSDMYSFGVVLLEIICGRPPIDIRLSEEKINIVRWVTPYLQEMDENGGEIIEIIDKRLCGSYDIKSITGVAKVAMRCVQAVPSFRPSVGEVVAELKEAMKHEDKDSISIAEDIGIQNEDLVAVMADWNKREGMEWSDNSSNISKVGR